MKTVPKFWFEPYPWIDGDWHRDGVTTEVLNPATAEPLAAVAVVDAAVVGRAIDGAVAAQRDWARTPAAQRGRVVGEIGRLLLRQKDEFARLLTAEQGKPYAHAVAEIDYAASFFSWFGEEARRVHGRIVPHPEPDREFLIRHKPCGVAGLITPWNFPLAQGAKKIAACLAAGCAAVWKPAEATPLVALGLAPLAAEAGLPAGLLQIVPGPGPLVGGVFAEHPQVPVISLTGSTATGSTLMAAAAPGIKRLSLELGGNAPFIVLPGADLDFVAEQLVRLKLFVSGQVCVTANRVFVDEAGHDALAERLVERFAAAKVGNGLDESVEIGPLIDGRACEKVGSLVDEAVAGGARALCQNRGYENDESLRAGSFFPPTVLVDVRDEMRIAREEVFGPVLGLLSYRGVGEAVRRANETPQGLAGYVYGRDLGECRAVAESLQVGIVGINEWRPLKAEIPFGGVKQSGIGVEGGEEGIREFLDTQVISLPVPPLEP